jgi:tRNA(Ile)-lysidine synthase
MTKRSHPPTILKLAERAIREHELIRRGDRILCGVSGGPDSMCLLHVLAHLRERLGFELAAAGVDHGLRDEAAGELALAARASQGLEVPFEVLSVEVAAGANLQDRARRARHAALQRHASAIGAEAIALGHTADDRAETVLIRLLRGAGPRGLGAMPPTSAGVEGNIRLVRPLLSGRREDVLAHLRRHEVDFAEDPSNADRRFLRVRVRHEVLPLLEELSPNIVEHLCSLADMLSALDESPLDGLGRSQRQALEKTLKQGLRGAAKAITLRLKGHRELFVRFRRSSFHRASRDRAGRPPKKGPNSNGQGSN